MILFLAKKLFESVYWRILIFLSNKFVWNWCQSDWFWWTFNNLCFRWFHGLTFADDLLFLSASFTFLGIIFLDATQEVGTTLWLLDMFNTNVDSFWKDLSTMSLVDDYTQTVLCYIINSPSFPVICFEWHTFMNGTMTLEWINS